MNKFDFNYWLHFPLLNQVLQFAIPCWIMVCNLHYPVNRIMKDFAIYLKTAREKQKLTQKDLARELDVSLNTYKTWECRGVGHRTPPLEMEAKIAEVLDITIDELVGR